MSGCGSQLRGEIIRKLTGLMAGAFFVGVSNGLLLPVLPLLAVETGVPLEWAGLSIAVFSLAAVGARPLFGELCDRGRGGVYETLLVAAATYSLASLLYAVVRNPFQLLCLRAFHGIGLSAWLQGSNVLAIKLAPPQWRATFIGLVSGATMVATVLGPFAGERLLAVSPDLVYYAAAGSGFVALLVAMFIRDRGDIDGVRFSPEGAVEAFGVRGAGNWALCAAVGAVASAYGCYVGFLPLYGAEFGVGNVSVFYVAFAAANTVARLPAGRLCDVRGASWVLRASVAAAVAGVGCLYWGITPPFQAISGALFGLGLSGVYPAVSLLLITSSRPEQWGRSMVTFNNAFDIGIVFGSLGLGYFIRIWGFPELFALSGLVVAVGSLPALVSRPQASPRLGARY